MKTHTSSFTRMAFAAVSLLCLGASVMAGPEPRYMMIEGKMMELRPMTKDVTLKNGCTVCTGGIVKHPKGKTVKLTNGDIVSSEGEKMKPLANQAHGG